MDICSTQALPELAQLRLILQALPDAQRRAFFLDYFPDFDHQLSDGMTATQQVSAFLRAHKPPQVWPALVTAGLAELSTGASAVEAHSVNQAGPASSVVPLCGPMPRNALFIGEDREQVLRELHVLLQEHRGVALCGIAGLGKSTILREYAQRQSERDGYSLIFWMLGSSHSLLRQSFAELAQFLHSHGLVSELPAEPTIAALVHIAQSWLARHDGWLLLWDNADAPAELRALVPQGRRGRILLSTRAPDPSVLGFEPYELPEYTMESALLLLHKRSQRRPQRDSTPDEMTAAGAIVRELGKLPLALEQAAAYVAQNRTTYRRYLSAYQQRALELFPEDPSDARASLRSVWSLSFQSIEQQSPAAADLLRASAYYGPDHIPEALIIEGAGHGWLGPHLHAALRPRSRDAQGRAELDAQIDALLEPLLRHALIRRNAETRTYSVHRMVQEATRFQLIGPEHDRSWTERALCALEAVFPEPEVGAGSLCDALAPCVESLLPHIHRHALHTAESARLLSRTGQYLRRQAESARSESAYERALSLHLHASALSELVLGHEHPSTAQWLEHLAQLHYRQGRVAQAEPLLRRALLIHEKSLGCEHPQTARTKNSLASLLHELGGLPEAEALYRQALAVLEATLGSNHPDAAQAMNNLAQLYQTQGLPEHAEPLYLRALSIVETAFGPDHPSVARLLNNLAQLLQDQGRWVQAESLYRRVHAISERTLGAEHPEVATLLNNLASLRQAQGEPLLAERLYRRAVAICEKALGPAHPDTARVMNNLASLLQDLGESGQAMQLYRRTLPIFEAMLGSEHPETATLLSNQASVLQSQGEWLEAEALVQRAIKIRTLRLGSQQPDLAASLNNLATLKNLQERYDEARDLAARAVAIFEKSLGREHPMSLIARGTYDDARNAQRLVR